MLNLISTANTDLFAISNMDLNLIDTNELGMALKKGMEITGVNLVLLGKIWVELENRGIDLADYRKDFAQFIPLIGRQKLSATLALRHAGDITILKLLSTMPRSAQDKLETQQLFDLAVMEDGVIVKKTVNLDNLYAAEARLAFSTEGIRSFEEQRDILLKHSILKVSKNTRRSDIKIDYRKKVIKAKGVEILLEDIYLFFAKHTRKPLEDVVKYLDILPPSA